MQFVILNILNIYKSKKTRGTITMAMLLAMFQKMRLIREYNQESLNLMRFSSKVDRIAKSIKNVQKMYEGKIKTLEQQAKLGTSIFKYKALNGNNSAANMMAVIMGGLGGKSTSIWNAYNKGTLKFNEDGTGGTYGTGANDKFTKDEYTAYNQAYQQAQMQVSMAQSQLQMQCQNEEQYVQMQVEAIKAQLEAEQDAALEPLEYEQTMMELDKEASEERCQRLKAEMESYDQLLKEETKNAAPKFGLG